MVIIDCYVLEGDEFLHKKSEYSFNRLDKVVVKVVNDRKKYRQYNKVIVKDSLHIVIIEENEISI